MVVGVMFPGQGAQSAGLGEPWQDRAEWSVVTRAEAVLDRPLAHLLLDSDSQLDRTEHAQMAVLLTSLMAWESLQSEAAATLGEPVGFAGHSLGQMTALIAAGVLSFEDGIALAARRARHTQEAADRRPGEMAALLGAGIDQAEEACRAAPDACWLANDNAPGQVVVAGTPEGTAAAGEKASSLGVRKVTRLRVGGAFHTPLMEDAAAAFAQDLDGVSFASPSALVISNGDACAYEDGEGWQRRLVDHLVRPVRWRESVEALVGLGATELVEVGPGNTLSGLAKRIVPQVPVRNVDSLLEEVGV